MVGVPEETVVVLFTVLVCMVDVDVANVPGKIGSYLSPLLISCGEVLAVCAGAKVILVVIMGYKRRPCRLILESFRLAS